MASIIFKKPITKLSPSQERVAFTRKVINAAKASNFSPKELRRLEKLLDNVNKRDLVLLYGVISTLKLVSLPQTSIKNLRAILSAAYHNILSGLKPFDKRTIAEITNELEKTLSKKVASKLTQDLLNGDESFITGLLRYLNNA